MDLRAEVAEKAATVIRSWEAEAAQYDPLQKSDMEPSIVRTAHTDVLAPLPVTAGTKLEFSAAVRQYRDARARLRSPLWDALLSIINNLQTISFVLCFLVLADRLRLQTVIGVLVLGSALTIGSIIADVLLHKWSVQLVPDAVTFLSGIAAGLALAMLVTRLASKYLGLPMYAKVLLLSYSLLQLSWLGFHNRIAMLVIPGLALFLKLVFYSVVAWLFESGRLMFYFHDLIRIDTDPTRPIDERIDEEYERFLKTCGLDATA